MFALTNVSFSLGANADFGNYRGLSPLHIAAANGHSALVRLFRSTPRLTPLNARKPTDPLGKVIPASQLPELNKERQLAVPGPTGTGMFFLAYECDVACLLSPSLPPLPSCLFTQFNFTLIRIH